MKFGNLEVRWNGRTLPPYAEPARDLSGIFAVSELEPWYLAVHQCVNEIEREANEAARNRVSNTNQCISAIGAAEGAAMVRLRLIEKRENALREKKTL
jgi:hypothetical protein